MHSVASLPYRRSNEPCPPSQVPRRASFTFPDRFQDSKDAHLDVASPKSKRGQYMNQPFLSMIANVGSNITPEPHIGLEVAHTIPKASSQERLSTTTSGNTTGLAISSFPRNDDTRNKTHTSERMFRSTPGIKLKKCKSRRSNRSRLAQVKEDMASSQILQPIAQAPPIQEETATSETQIPTFNIGEDGQVDSQSSGEESSPSAESSDSGSDGEDNVLAIKVAQVYGFIEVEEIRLDFPCWLVQSVVVRGRLYVTTKHVCFYAFLPRRSGNTAKSGFFFKRGPRNPRYHRYWFVLKGNVLSYYKSSSSLYFPQGNVDLRNAVSAQLEEATDDSNGKGFSVTTSQQTYRFKAESIASAQEWVKKIQRAIFHSHTAGNTVKICLPIQNMLEVEENPMFENWNTLKIKVVDNDETFAIDEYFFSLMNCENNVLQLLKSAIAENTLSPDHFGDGPDATPKTRQSPTFAPRNAQVWEDTTNENVNRSSSMLTSSSDIPVALEAHGHSDESFDEVASSSAIEDSESENNGSSTMSASKILQGSDVFHQSENASHGEAKTVQSDEEEAGVASRGQGGSRNPRRLQFLETEKANAMTDSAATIQPLTSSSKLQTIKWAGETSMQKATGIAGAVRNSSRQVGTRIVNESKVYYEKVTNMWTGKTMHFDTTGGPMSPENLHDSQEELPESKHAERFRTHFALPDTERLQSTYHGFLVSGVPVHGKLYLSQRKLCFRSLLPTTRTKMILPLRDIITVDKSKGFNFGYSGLVIIVSGHEELFLEFARPEARDDLAIALQKRLSRPDDIEDSRVMDEKDREDLDAAKNEYEALEQARDQKRTASDSMFESIAIDDEEDSTPVIFDDMNASIVDFNPPSALRIVCLTIGSRGDVQPYIALCKGLMREGHRPLIATHAEFESWIRKHGIDFAPVAGNPAEIMALCVENDTFTMNFFREVASKMRPWFDALLDTSWKACQGADVLIESPSAMAGVHIAQALQIPYFRAFSMMWTRTRAYPHPFVVPKQKLGGNYNYLSYVIVDKFLWQAGAYQINKWRTQTLGLQSTGLERLKLNNVPFLYNFSPSIVARPLDFSPWIHVTGNWFLDESKGWKPPPELEAFIEKARNDGKKLVYVGFGSMVVENRTAMTKTIVDSVLKADVRCIFSKGWSDRLERPYDSAEILIPEELIVIKSAPHDWLFDEIDAAVHHGGAGTTAASLRAGVPTIVRPFFGDQKFYGARVEDLGVGRCLDNFNTSLFSRALWEVTHNERIVEKARLLGEKIRAEDGVAIAIQAIYRDMEYAKSLIKHQGLLRGEGKSMEEDQSTQDWTMVDDDLAEFGECEADLEGSPASHSQMKEKLGTVNKGVVC